MPVLKKERGCVRVCCWAQRIERVVFRLKPRILRHECDLMKLLLLLQLLESEPCRIGEDRASLRTEQKLVAGNEQDAVGVNPEKEKWPKICTVFHFYSCITKAYDIHYGRLWVCCSKVDDLDLSYPCVPRCAYVSGNSNPDCAAHCRMSSTLIEGLC